MAAYGIPSYRLPRDVIFHEVDIIQKMGAEIHYNTSIGKDINIEDLAHDGYKAVFLGMGAPESSKMRCEGEDEGYEGFIPGVDFLAESARGRKALTGKKVVVIGGGNVAMDCVRTSKRFGFEEVRLLYRRTEAEMPADPHEIREAKEEGVIFDFLVAPVRIISEENIVKGLECIKMELGEPDESGRRRPVPKKGSEFIIDCDAIIPAVGQVCRVDMAFSNENSPITSWKTLVADDTTFQTDVNHIFGGGDCVTGPKTLIAALAAGKHAARYIDDYLNGGKCSPKDADLLETIVTSPEIFRKKKSFCYPGFSEKAEGDVLDPEDRINGFDEVEGALSPSQARKEAERCLRCYRLLMAAV
jgi:formate dehydrogenase beta subunit